MKPIHKYNNGNGAMLCNGCRTIISTGPKTEEVLCEKCKGNITLKQKFFDVYTKYCKKSSEDDIEESSIDDFSDDEVFDELLHRYKIQKDIVSVNKIKEFLNNYYI